ncbi:MAG: endonuclease [Bacteroidetes bacterium]|nr:MAG: endonuclease [Bacteroidota bacterium]
MPMKNIAILTALIFITLQPLYSQRNVKSFLVVSYNVENLYDTVNSPLFEDDEFTPSGEKAWTYDRYKKKLNDLARVVMSIPGKELPALIGLSEIENRKVLEDLASQRGLRKGDYKIVHEDGQDPRGIECALLYRPDLFKYKSHEYVPIDDPVDPDYLYRGILHVKGKAPDGSSLHIFVNHWKSRSGGEQETERQRMFSAISLRKQMDLLMARESGFKVIVMGDFNDEPTNRSLTNGLSALNKRRNIQMGDYYNLFYDLHNIEGKGTYNYQGNWNMLDQVIISYNLLDQERGLTTGFGSGVILKEEWMLYVSEKYGESLPSATYGGPEYYGGPSDHLPVYVEFTW